MKLTTAVRESLDRLGPQLCCFLETRFTSSDEPDWWEKLVVAHLSYQQRLLVDQQSKTSLCELDVAALLRVLDKNVYELGLSSQARTLCKLVAEARNQLAHKPAADDLAPEDAYRSLDAIERLLAVVDAPADEMESVKRARERVAAAMAAAATPDTGKEAELGDVGVQPAESEETEMDKVLIDYLLPGISNHPDVAALLSKCSYVGIDFGTSTTVVSVVSVDPDRDVLRAEPLPIRQYDDLGRETQHHLVPSCIAWTGKDMLIGTGAAQLRHKYKEGVNVWSSFKMRLGADLGPVYYNSVLTGSNGSARIVTPQDAAAEFFRYLKREIEASLAHQELPTEVVYAVSVPASFESNQRQDLCNALAAAGIELAKHGIIDEPNAAFVEYLMEKRADGTWLLDDLRKSSRRYMVFDFGAGTCDISILEVGCETGRFVSRNMAISRFHALGGDNLDRTIVRDVLLKQLVEQNSDAANLSSAELEQGVIPVLQRSAEMLKITCCKQLATRRNGKNLDKLSRDETPVVGKDSPPIEIRRGQGVAKLQLKRPTISQRQFSDVLSGFLRSGTMSELVDLHDGDVISILEPVVNALQKAELDKDRLDMVLFVGGSSLNPHVQNAIEAFFGRFIECEVPRDPRTLVSGGVALNSFIANGLGCEFIRPITSEPFYVVTRNGLRQLLLAGTEIPCAERDLTSLKISRDGQVKVQIPICVSGPDKPLGVLEVDAPASQPFVIGDEVRIVFHLTENKLLAVRASVAGNKTRVALLNPLANKQLTPSESALLESRRLLNKSILDNGGKPE